MMNQFEDNLWWFLVVFHGYQQRDEFISFWSVCIVWWSTETFHCTFHSQILVEFNNLMRWSFCEVFFFFIFHVECIIIQVEMYKSAKRFLEHLTNEANNRSEINDMIEVNDMNSGTNLWFILGIASELRSNDKRTNNLDTLTSSEPNFWPPS